jgi:hypothetical protein
VPLLPWTVEDMVAHPYETMSDSFYFVDGTLVMHNKAYYSYYVDETTITGTSAWCHRGPSQFQGSFE